MAKYMLEVTLVFMVEAENEEQAENQGWGYWRGPGLGDEEVKVQPDTVHVKDPMDYMDGDGDNHDPDDINGAVRKQWLKYMEDEQS